MTEPLSRNPRVWLTRYVSLQKQYDRKIAASLEQAASDAEKRIQQIAGKNNISAVVERAQLTASRLAIQRVLELLWESIGKTTRDGQQAAAVLATDVGWNWDQVLLRRAIPDAATRRAMKDSLNSASSRNVEAAIARMTRSAKLLSSMVYSSRLLSSGYIDTRINSALARGLSVTNFAKEIKDSIRPDTPGGVAFAAKRLARTEINAAYHAVSVDQNRDKPWNTGMGWYLSKSHPVPDLCNLYADRSPYPLGGVPSKPHPNCLCYTAPITVTPEEFIVNYRNGDYDDYIAGHYGRPTRRVA